MKRGFTLIELLVYMAIMGFIVVVAGRVFSDATSMRVRSQNMIKTTEEVGRVANLISEDISQMGARSWGGSSTSGGGETEYVIEYDKDVYMSASSNDSSSFRLIHEHATSNIHSGVKFDSIVFRKADFNENGVFQGVREIYWAVNGNEELHRGCKTISGPENVECPSSGYSPVLIAGNVRKFSFIPSAPGMPTATGIDPVDDITVFPSASSSNFTLIQKNNNNSIPGSNDNPAKIDNFNPNPDETGEVFEQYYFALNNTNCLPITIKDGETYVVEFKMPFENTDTMTTQFLPGKDHIAIGLRYNNDNDGKNPPAGISSDVLFYAPQDVKAANAIRYAEFSRKGGTSTTPLCVALTFAFYSPNAYRGSFRFSDFKIYKKTTGAYHFVKKSEDNNYSEDLAKKYASELNTETAKLLKQKKNVKAFELILEIERNGEVAGTYSKGTTENKDSTGMAIPVPNNGVTQ